MKDIKKSVTLVNEDITFPRVQLISKDGENLGIVNRELMLRIAAEAGMDAVVVADKGSEGFPLVKIMDFGKSQYEKKKKQADAKKRQKVIQTKEIKIRPIIGEHDYATKINQAVQFLNEGKRLKITLVLRGRELATRNERIKEFFEKIQQTFQERNLLQDLIQEKEVDAGQFWSRIYYLKGK